MLCFQCGPDVKMLNIRFKPGSIPPYIDHDYTGCVMCDKNIQEAFNLSMKSSANNQNTQNNNGNNNRPQTNNGNRGNGPGTMGNNNKGKTSQKPRTNNNNSAGVRPRPQADNQGEGGDNQPVCECGTPAIQLTVRKEGANQGML